MIDTSQFAQLEQKNGLPPGSLSAVMQQESGGNPNVVSPKGAMGPFQFMPETAQQYGINPYDVSQAAPAAAHYLGTMQSQLGSFPAALAGYNWGPGNVQNRGVQNAPPETQNYVSSIMGKIGSAVVPSAQAAENTFDVTMPDGTLVKGVPQGTTQAQLMDKLSRYSQTVQQPAVQTQLTPNISISNTDQSASQPAAQSNSSLPAVAQNNANVQKDQQSDTQDDDNYFGFIPLFKSMLNTASAPGQMLTGQLKPGTEAGAAAGRDVAGMVAGGDAFGAAKPAMNLAEVAAAAKGAASDVQTGFTKVMGDKIPSDVKLTPTPPVSSDTFKDAAQKSYALADQKGGVLTPEFTNNFVDEAKSISPQTEAGKIVAGDSTLTQLNDRMDALRDKPITLAAAQEIDEGLGKLIDSEYTIKGLSKDGKQIYDLQTKFRDMMNDAAKNGQVQGSTEGLDAWKQGQAQWSQAMAMRDIESIMNRASQTDNPATSLRTQFRSLANNPSRMRGFTSDAEKQAIKNAANTGALTGVLKVFGSRLIPIIAGAGEAVTSGGLTGGLVAGTIAQGLSSGSRNLASKMQMNKAQNVLQTIAKRPSKVRK